jgi:hydroxymethylpyrimidine/phosphomethylpyrimidine kinase
LETGKVKVALTIAGSDSSGGAGIQADLKVFADLGVYGVSAITAVTAQNSLGVQKVNKVPPRIVAAQIDSVTRDIGVDSCKIGMLYSQEVVSLVAERIERRNIPNVVLDPIVFAKDGTRLLHARAVQRMKRYLIPKCTLVMPNLAEAGILSGREVTSIDNAKDAARAIFDLGTKFVLIKGGHFADEPVDLLFDGTDFMEFHGKRVQDKNLHGTGCILSAAIAARLASGDNIPDAVGFAKDFITQALKNSIKFGIGELWYYAGALS